MTNDLENQIRDAIDKFDTANARDLLRKALENPTAEIYFLASMVAVNARQKRDFLEKAISLDPFHEAAHEELERADETPPSSNKSTDSESQKVDLAPARLTVDMGAQIKNAFNNVGYRHPDTIVSRDYSKAIKESGLAPFDITKETVILHVGVNRWLAHNIQCLAVRSRKGGEKEWQYSLGNLIFTNYRAIILYGTLSDGEVIYDLAIDVDYARFSRVEIAEKNNFTQYSLVSNSGEEFIMDMGYRSPGATFGYIMSIASSISKSNSDNNNLVGYLRDKDAENATNDYIIQSLSKVNNIKQLFTQFLHLIVASPK